MKNLMRQFLFFSYSLTSSFFMLIPLFLLLILSTLTLSLSISLYFKFHSLYFSLFLLSVIFKNVNALASIGISSLHQCFFSILRTFKHKGACYSIFSCFPAYSSEVIVSQKKVVFFAFTGIRSRSLGAVSRRKCPQDHGAPRQKKVHMRMNLTFQWGVACFISRGI